MNKSISTRIRKNLARLTVMAVVLANLGLSAPIAQAVTVVHDSAGEFDAGTHSQTRYSIRQGDPSRSVLLTGTSEYNPDANTSLLLEMEGTNGSTSFLDGNSPAKTVTAYGDANTSTAELKYGISSGHFDGSGDYLGVDGSSDFNFGSGDFTVDLWVKYSSGSAPHLVSYSDDADGWYLLIDTDGQMKAWKFGTNTYSFKTSGAPNVMNGSWHHVAFLRNGDYFRIYVDGNEYGSYSDDTAVSDYSGELRIGSWDGAVSWTLDGYLDNVRITKGKALWTSSFTPPDASVIYDASGTYTSSVIEGEAATDWQTLTASTDVPANTALSFETRSGDTATPDGSWSSWAGLSGSAIASPDAQYLQYKAALSSSDSAVSPAIYYLTVNNDATDYWRWRDDNGDESAATWMDSQATAISGLDKNVSKRLRFGVAGPADGTLEPRLEYALKPGGSCAAASGWTQVGSSNGAWVMSGSSHLTHGAASSDLPSGLTDAAATFVPGRLLTTDATGSSIAVGDTGFTEVEWSVKAGLSAQDGATYCFRVTDAGTSLAANPGYAEATLNSAYGPTRNNSLTLSRLSVDATADVSLVFDLDGTVSTQLSVTFPAGFTLTGAFTSGSCSGGGTVSGFAFDGLTLTADKSSCAGTVSLSGATVTNPSAAGLYAVDWVNDQPGQTVIPIVDDDAVSVYGNVDPTLAFDIDVSTGNTETAQPYLVDLGGLSATAPSGSNGFSVPSIWLDLETNATSGAVVTVRSAYAALQSASVPADTIDSQTETLTANNEGYGICVASATGTLRSENPALSFAIQAPYDDSGNCTSGFFSVGLLQTGDQDLLVATGPLKLGRAQVRVGIGVRHDTPAHPDYTDTLTFMATATY